MLPVLIFFLVFLCWDLCMCQDNPLLNEDLMV
jgi:hypothetical protein